MDIEEQQEVVEPEERVAPEQFVEFVTESVNIAEDLEEGELSEIARDVLSDYKADKDSMSEWLENMKRGIELATLIKEEKSYPFPKAANVKYPLITSAALQFNARAYPAIVPSGNSVMVKTFGNDPQGKKAARGERVSSHMSWQLTNEIEEWEEETDKLLVQLPVVGTMVRKVWYDPILERPRCKVIDAGKFIVNDRVKSMEDAPRASEELPPMYPSEITSRVNAGLFLDIDYGMGEDSDDTQSPHEFIEQHTLIDLDDDGYPEPYIVTLHKSTESVVRIVADFSEEDVFYKTETRSTPVPVQGMDQFGQIVTTFQQVQEEVKTGIKAIRRGSYFVPYHFIPSMEGKFHGTGLGILLGDISDSINSILNMLLDAGHMSSLGGGFIGSEFRLKGGNNRFKPGEWKTPSTTGGDIRNAIVPMTFPGPDAVLFQMLGMLIDAGREIASVKDIMTGDNGGKVQTATTTIALIEQGMMVFTASYKRIYRSLKREYKLLARINSTTVSPEAYNMFLDEVDENGQPVMYDPAQDYGAADMDISPVADPRSVTKMQEAAKAQLLLQMSDQGIVDKGEAASRVMEASDISNREELAVKPDPMAQQMAQMQTQMMQADIANKMADVELTIAKVQESKAKAMKDLSDADLQQREAEFDALMRILEMQRDGLNETLTRGLGGMAGKPGNVLPKGMSGPVLPVTEAGGVGRVLGGESPF